MRSTLVMASGVATLLAVSDVRAQEGQLTTEIHCLVATTIVMRTAPALNAQDALTTMAIHYISRIDVRDPSLDISAALIQARPHVETAGVQNVFGRCADSFAEKMKSFSSVMRAARK